MSNPYFKFKQFTVWHDRCAMKVGTDGVLLGTLATLPLTGRVLDVGTGTGLVSLIVAQRSGNVIIDVIEIDPSAAEQARENIERSDWKERIFVHCCDFNDYSPDLKYDLIISNPPFFVDALRNPDRQRSTARHADTLNFEQLLGHGRQLLADNGRLCLIVPAKADQMLADAAWRNGFLAVSRIKIHSKPQKPLKRMVLMFKKLDASQPYPAASDIERDFYLMNEDGQYSQEYRQLTEDFYVKL